MHKQEKRMYGYTDVVDLYHSGKECGNLEAELLNVIKFFKEGYAWYNRNINDTGYGDFYDYLDWLEDFKKTSEAMGVDDNAKLVIKGDRGQINLDPFIDFINQHGTGMCIMYLQIIQGMMVDFLHEGNILKYKESIGTLSRAELAFYEITRFSEE